MISCIKEYDYEFIVYNKTNYKINSFKIDNIVIEIEPNDTSERITWYYEGSCFNFSEPLLGLYIAEYSDSLTEFKNSIGKVTSICDLNKKSVNRVEINLCNDNQNEDYIFDIKVN
jgi:hypothetical protein